MADSSHTPTGHGENELRNDGLDHPLIMQHVALRIQEQAHGVCAPRLGPVRCIAPDGSSYELLGRHVVICQLS